jgi:hypothetical protein
LPLRRYAATLIGVVLGLHAHGARAQGTVYLPDSDVFATRVDPEETANGVRRVSLQGHYVATPMGNDLRNDKLIVFLSGSRGSASDYTGIANRMASQGYSVILMDYENEQVVAAECDKYSEAGPTAVDSCYAQTRGEVIFGRAQSYGSGFGIYQAPPALNFLGNPTSASTAGNVTLPNSIIYRLVAALNWLQYQPTLTNAAGRPTSTPAPIHWGQFLVDDAASPYVVPTISANGSLGTGTRKAYPVWSRIILAGHSQGAGHAAFAAQLVSMHRVVLFSGPNDHVPGLTRTATESAGLFTSTDCPSPFWMTRASATPLLRYWGLRVDGEGDYGQCSQINWANLGGATEGVNNGGVGAGTPTGNDTNDQLRIGNGGQLLVEAPKQFRVITAW